MLKEVYLDNSATTRPYNEVIEYMDHIHKNIYGNPSSLHRLGMEAEKRIREARESIATSMGADSREIVFTSGGTESNNLAVRGYLEANPRKGKHILTTEIEHPSVLEVFKHLAGQGYEVGFIKVDRTGKIDGEELKSKIRRDTALLSVMLINNEIGTLQSVEEIAKIKNSINREAAFHVDAVQAYGKIRINPKKIGIDMLSVSSHKIHGPKGIGALYINRNIRIKPILYGGGQESLLRSGTENVPGICGFGLAASMASEKLEDHYKKTEGLKALFMDRLSENIEGFKVLSPEEASPYIVNISFQGVKSEVLLHHLAERNIYVSTGSACSSRKSIHSHVLKAIGIPGMDIEGAIRFSLSANNTEEELSYTVEALKEILPRIKIKSSLR